MNNRIFSGAKARNRYRSEGHSPARWFGEGGDHREVTNTSQRKPVGHSRCLARPPLPSQPTPVGICNEAPRLRH